MLDIESTNVKGLYRRAQASMQLGDLDLAEIDVKKALEVEPDNRYMQYMQMINTFGCDSILFIAICCFWFREIVQC